MVFLERGGARPGSASQGVVTCRLSRWKISHGVSTGLYNVYPISCWLHISDAYPQRVGAQGHGKPQHGTGRKVRPVPVTL
jgi:hypothetical protein